MLNNKVLSHFKLFKQQNLSGSRRKVTAVSQGIWESWETDKNFITIQHQDNYRNELAQAACVRHACLRAPCVAWPLLLPSFSLFFLFSLLRLLLFTHFRESPLCKNLFSPIFWDIPKKKLNLGNFYFFTKKVEKTPKKISFFL